MAEQTLQVSPGSGQAIAVQQITSLNGAVVSSRGVQRVIHAQRVGDDAVQDGPGFGGTPVSVTRPNDTTPYLANDVIGPTGGGTAAMTFANMGPSAGCIMLTGAELLIEASAIISGETSYRLHLYSATPPSALADNAAFDLPSGDRASYLGYIDLGSVVDIGSTLHVQTLGINKQLRLAGTSLFGYLVTIGAYTPTAQRVHKVNLHAVGL